MSQVAPSRLFLLSLCMGSVVLLGPRPVSAEIRFQEFTREAGIDHAGPSYGASWGDLDGDGWPDLWVGNHNTKPSLYLNRKNGTLQDIIDKVWSGDPKADTHGAAWADFDNDGDQDLVELVAAKENSDGTFCSGCGENHFFKNKNPSLLQTGADVGLNNLGLGGTPLWLDANGDGLLDLLVSNTRGKGQPDSVAYLQNKEHRFTPENEAVGFKDGPWDGYMRIRGRIESLLNLKQRSVPQFCTHRFMEFGQLSDLDSDGRPDLVFFSPYTRVYDIARIPFEELSMAVGLPILSDIKDVAIGDFNGDLKMDMAVVQGSWLPPHFIQVGPAELKGMLRWSGPNAPKAIHFEAHGELRVQIYPTWLPLNRVFIGSGGEHPQDREFVLSSRDPKVHGAVNDSVPGFEGVIISHDPETGRWTIRNVQRSGFVDFIVNAADSSITDIEPVGFAPYRTEGKGLLFLREGRGFEKRVLAGESGEHTACISAAAGDFDNDMDLDLYLVCTGPIMNLPNQLLENDGTGNFRAALRAGGASGSALGRGDVVAVADYDRDGFLDLFVTNGADPASPFVAEGPHQLFRNLGNGNHWLQIDLEGTVSNRDGIGSTVMLEVGGIAQIRQQGGGIHRIAQNHQRSHFGLGGNDTVDRITVTWPSGIVQRLDNVTGDQILRIIEPSEDSR